MKFRRPTTRRPTLEAVCIVRGGTASAAPLLLFVLLLCTAPTTTTNDGCRRCCVVEGWTTTTIMTTTRRTSHKTQQQHSLQPVSKHRRATTHLHESFNNIEDMPFFIEADDDADASDEDDANASASGPLTPDPEEEESSTDSTPPSTSVQQEQLEQEQLEQPIEIEQAWNEQQKQKQQSMSPSVSSSFSYQPTLFRPDVQSKTRSVQDDLSVEKDMRVAVPNMAKTKYDRTKHNNNNNNKSNNPSSSRTTSLFRPDVQSVKRTVQDDLSVEKDMRVAVPSMSKAKYSTSSSTPKVQSEQLQPRSQQQQPPKSSGQRTMLRPSELPSTTIPIPKEGLFDISGTGYDSKKRNQQREKEKQKLMQQQRKQKLPAMLQPDVDQDEESVTTAQSDEVTGSLVDDQSQQKVQQPQQQQELTRRQKDLLVDRDVRVAFPSLERKKLDRTMMQPSTTTSSSLSNIFSEDDDYFKVDGSGYESETDKERKRQQRRNQQLGIGDLNDDSTLPYNAQPNMMMNRQMTAPTGGSMARPASMDHIKATSRSIDFEYENWGSAGNGGTNDGIGFTEVRRTNTRRSMTSTTNVDFGGRPVSFRQEGRTDDGPNPMFLTENKQQQASSTLNRPSSSSSSSNVEPTKKPMSSTSPNTSTTTTTTKQDQPTVDDDVLRSEVAKAHSEVVEAMKKYASSSLADSQQQQQQLPSPQNEGPSPSVDDTSSTITSGGDATTDDISTTGQKSIEEILEASGGIDEILKSDNPLAMIDEIVAREVAKAEQDAKDEVERLTAAKDELLRMGNDDENDDDDHGRVGGVGEGDEYDDASVETIHTSSNLVDASQNEEFLEDNKPELETNNDHGRSTNDVTHGSHASLANGVSSQQISFVFGRKVQLASDDDVVYNKR